MRTLSTLALLLLIALSTGQAQPGQVPLRPDAHPGPEGVWIITSLEALAPDARPGAPAAAVILRADGDGGSYREVGRAVRVPDVRTLRAVVSPATIDNIPVDTLTDRAIGDEELWRYVVTHTEMGEYDVAILDPRLRLALGMVWLDSTVRNDPPGTRYTYKVRYVDASGATLRESDPIPVTVNVPLQTSKPELLKTVERDSMIAVTWWMPYRGNEKVAGGVLYRQTGGYGPYERIETALQPAQIGDTLRFYWEESEVGPNEMYSYVLVPTGLMGQPGTTSDTIVGVSVSFREIDLLGNLRASDTADGIHLSWDPIAPTPFFLGIEISRSGEALTGYAPIDTVPLEQNHYIDVGAPSLLPVYYRLKAVTFREIDDAPSAGVTGVHRPLDRAPDAPYAVEAAPEGRNIRLRWRHVADTALWGYLVYRGTATLDSMVVVSRALRDTTWLDTSAILSGRTAYAYRVKAVSLGELEGPFSEAVIVRPARQIAPPAPLGMTGYADAGAVRLFWTDAAAMDLSVAGYRVWRRPARGGSAAAEDIREGEPGSRAAARLGYLPLIPDTIETAAFDDTSAGEGMAYEYAVSSVDDFGVESPLGPAFRIAVDPAAAPEAPAALYARAVDRGVEVSWDPVADPGARGYVVWRRSRNETELRPVARLGSNETVWTDAGSQSETIYAVSTAGAGGDGRPGAERMVVTGR